MKISIRMGKICGKSTCKTQELIFNQTGSFSLGRKESQCSPSSSENWQMFEKLPTSLNASNFPKNLARLLKTNKYQCLPKDWVQGPGSESKPSANKS